MSIRDEEKLLYKMSLNFPLENLGLLLDKTSRLKKNRLDDSLVLNFNQSKCSRHLNSHSSNVKEIYNPI